MRRTLFLRLVYVVLFIFAPLALIPATGRSALLPSPAGSPTILKTLPGGVSMPAGFLTKERSRYLTEEETAALTDGGGDLLAGGQLSESLETNELIAVFITLLMIGVVIGFVEQTRK